MTSAAQRFSELFERTHGAVLAYAVRRSDDPADAADAVAETFLVAWRRLDRVPEGSDERAWLFGVARRVLANQRRGQRRRRAMASRLGHELAVVLPAPVEREPSTLTEAIDRLSATDRELLRLLAWEDLSQEEAAVALGISTGALRVRLHRARRRLEAALGQPSTAGHADSATNHGRGR